MAAFLYFSEAATPFWPQFPRLERGVERAAPCARFPCQHCSQGRAPCLEVQLHPFPVPWFSRFCAHRLWKGTVFCLSFIFFGALPA